MNEALQTIYERNNEFMDKIIKKYRLKIKLEDLMSLQSVTIVSVPELPFGFRVFATSAYREEGKLKQHKQNLYNLMKKKLDFLSDEEIFEEREDFIKFVFTWKQTKFLFQSELCESQIQGATFLSKQPVILNMEEIGL